MRVGRNNLLSGFFINQVCLSLLKNISESLKSYYELYIIYIYNRSVYSYMLHSGNKKKKKNTFPMNTKTKRSKTTQQQHPFLESRISEACSQQIPCSYFRSFSRYSCSVRIAGSISLFRGRAWRAVPGALGVRGEHVRARVMQGRSQPRRQGRNN